MSEVRILLGSPNFRGIAKRPRQRTLTPSFDGSSPSTPATNDPLAQAVEHLTFNQGVRSSNLRWVTILQLYMERYRSGHNEAVLKTVWVQAHVGSNPTLSAIYFKDYF